MIELEHFNKEDFSRLISWINTEEFLIQFAGPTIFSFPITHKQLELYIANNRRKIFKVINLENNSIIGHAEIEIKGDKIGKFCRILIGDPNYRGMGLGTIVVSELLKISFIDLELNSTELNVYDWNKSAIKCYENVGFKIHKNKSKSNKVNGKIWTTLNMKITKVEWEKRIIKQT